MNESPSGILIVSGGQTGADRAALDWAIARGLPHAGWCPRGRRAEDGPLDAKYQLLETRSERYLERTERNVLDSDGTAVFSIEKTVAGGTKRTLELAEKHAKPHIHLAAVEAPSLLGAKLADFVRAHAIVRLNIAGPRGSKEPAVGELVQAALDAFAGELAKRGTGVARRAALWLVPESSTRARCAHEIARLASDFGAFPFEPHATLATGTCKAADAANVAERLSEFAIRSQGTRVGEELRRSLYVDLGADENWKRAMAAAAEVGLEPEPGPHVSLLYLRDLTPVRRRAPSDFTELALTEVAFSELALLHYPELSGGLVDPRTWSVAGRWPLRRRANAGR